MTAIIAQALLLLPGCRTYLHFRYGLTRPREESPATLAAFLGKNRYPAAGQYIFRDSASYGRAIRDPLFRKYFFSHLIFDRNGNLLERDTTKCQWAGYEKIRDLVPGGEYPRSSDLRLGDLLPAIRPLGSDTLIRDADFTVVILWAKFLGRYNYRLFGLAGAAAENTGARLRVIWLNLDMQAEWHLRDSQKMDFR